jgi:hypothetical protein
MRAVPWGGPGRALGGHSFNLRPINIDCVVDKVALTQVSL